MLDGQDPALEQESATDSTATDPQVEADPNAEGAESDAPQGDKEKAEAEGQAQEEYEIVVDGVTTTESSDEPAPSPKQSAAWAKLRKERATLAAENAELKRRMQPASDDGTPDPGPEPDLADEDVNYDQALFKRKLLKWNEDVRKGEAHKAEVAQRAEADRQRWQNRLETYKQSSAELSKRIPDYAEAEAAVHGMFDITQQGVILHGAENPALVVAALGKNPDLAKELAGTKDPIQFAFKVAKLEGRLKTQKKSNVPPPEQKVRGSAPGSGVDSQLERLRAEADRTGDRTKVVAYMNEQRRKQQRK